MNRMPVLGWLVMALFTLPCGVRAAAASPPAVYELQQAALATHEKLSLLAPVISDLLAVYHVAYAQAQQPDAQISSALPPSIRGTLHALAARAESLGPDASLPPLPRIYHARAQGALWALAQVEVLGDLLAPTRTLLGALQRLQAVERDLVQAQAEASAPARAAVDPIWPSPIAEVQDKLQHLVGLMAELPKPAALDAQVEVFFDPQHHLKGVVSWSVADQHARQGARLSICRVNAAYGIDGCHLDINPQAGRWQETLPEALWASPPSYRISTCSAFGVQTRPHTHRAVLTGDGLLGATSVTAVSLAPAADDARFYYDLDAVAVAWQLSVSDPSQYDWQPSLQLMRPHTLEGYSVYRTDDDTAGLVEQAMAAHDRALLRQAPAPEAAAVFRASMAQLLVAQLPPGTDHFVDRPTLAQLARGVRYLVVVQGADGAMAVAPTGLQQQLLKENLLPARMLAASGAQWARQPLLWEQRRSDVIRRDAPTKATLQRLFLSHSEVAQRALWEAFWRTLKDPRRLHAWQQAQADAAHASIDALRKQALKSLPELSLQALRLAFYIEEHGDLARAIEQHWALFDEPQRRDAGKGRPLAALVNLVTQRPDDALWGLAVAAWWHEQHQQQANAVNNSWYTLSPSAQTMMLGERLQRLPAATLRRLLWPDWQLLSADEQQRWLTYAPHAVISELWPELLAHLEFSALPSSVQRAHVKKDVGPWRSMIAQSRYSLRPVDKLMGFNMRAVLSLVGLGLLTGGLISRLRGFGSN